MRPFADTAPIYRSLGWLGTLPLPERAKHNPPDGWTGGHDRDPDDATVAAWASNGYASGNIAVRMPADVVGLDVDAYDCLRPWLNPTTGQVEQRQVSKRGAETLAELEATLGPLPATWRSSARSAPSGIYWLRVPAGVVITESAIPGDIEIIRRGHRYAVVPPSVNPETGTVVAWSAGSNAAGWQRQARPPRREELGWLPQAWAVRLSARPAPASSGSQGPSFWQPPKTIDSAHRQWMRLHDRFVGFVRRCELFGWGGDAHGQLLELTRELAQLAPAQAHRAVGQWFAEAGAGWVDPRVWAMLESALGKYPADAIVAPSMTEQAGIELRQPYGATMGSHAQFASAVESTSQQTAPGGDGINGSSLSNGESVTKTYSVSLEDNEFSSAPRRLPMIPDPVWDAYGWTRSIRARARVADVCPDAVLGSMLAAYAARVPPGVRIVTGTKMPLGTNLVAALVGPSGSDKSTAFNLALSIGPSSAVPVIANPGSGEAFAASFVHPDPDAEGAVTKRPKVLKPDPRALFYVSEGALLGSIGSRLGSTWLPHLRALAVDESLSTTNATSEINRQVPAQSYSAGVAIGFQVSTAVPILRDTGTGTAQRFLWFTSLSSEDAEFQGLCDDVPDVPMAVPMLTRLGSGIDDENRVIHYLAVSWSITERIKAEQRHFRLTRDITATDDHDAHRHTLVAKLAALAVLADGRVLIEERDWGWGEALYAASAAVRDELLAIAEESEQTERAVAADRVGEADRRRRQYDSAEARVAEAVLRRADRLGGQISRGEMSRALMPRDRHLIGPAVEQLERHGFLLRTDAGKWMRLHPQQ